jgi:hypothetical protein
VAARRGIVGRPGEGECGAVKANWYYVDLNGERVGPLELEPFCALFANGTLGLTTLVWTEQFKDWVEAGTIGGLREVAKHAPPPKPPPFPPMAGIVSGPPPMPGAALFPGAATAMPVDTSDDPAPAPAAVPAPAAALAPVAGPAEATVPTLPAADATPRMVPPPLSAAPSPAPAPAAAQRAA